MILATNNKNKVRQFKDLCADFELVSLGDCGIDIDIPETGTTAEENAIIKAKTIYELTKKSVVADDSGLYIDYFEGWPGMYTSRFLPNSTPVQRNDAIIEKMVNIDEPLRTAKVVCVLALCDKLGKIYTFRGEYACKIAHQQKGSNFFGFDSIVLMEDGRTLAELTEEEKQKYNARSIAFKKMIKAIKEEGIEI